MARHKNADWVLPENNLPWEGCQLAVLMDIRDLLTTLVNRINCYETMQIPKYLRDICRNTTRPRRRRAKA